MAAGDLDGRGISDLVIDFGAAYEDLSGWHQVHGLNPKAIATGRFF